ncbi:Ig-like domain-containing protein [Endozoicomonas arenosclerae]|uniref:Ig-like domain-containing protein n=1 Tax=Endozoicomonas arenosclerae TaxID=1633495 RepID=UPI000782BFB3|nr:Ig-like domain-containing protein [Endozoicomonas arenosclerae]
MANEDSAVTPTVTVVTARGVKDPDTGLPIELAKGTTLPLSLPLEVVPGGSLTVELNGKLLQITEPGTMTLGQHLKTAATIAPDVTTEVITETIVEPEEPTAEQKAAMAKAAKVSSPSDAGSIEMPAVVEVDQLTALPESSDSQITQLLNETAEARATRAELDQKEKDQKEAAEKALAEPSYTTQAAIPATLLTPAKPAPAAAVAPPEVPKVTAINPDSGVQGDGITRHSDLDVEGTGRPGDLIRLFVNEEATQKTTTVDNKGNWIISWQAPGEGQFDLSAKAIAGGMTSDASEPMHITVDQTPPRHEIETPEFTVYNLSPVEISGTCTPGLQVAITLDGKPAGYFQPTETGEWTLDLPLPAEAHGDYVYQFTITDAAGNATTRDVTVRSITAVYDVKVSPDSGKEGDGITNAENITVSGKCPPNSTVFLQYTTDGSPQTSQYPCSPEGEWTSESIHLPANAVYPFAARVKLSDGSFSKLVEFHVERDSRAYLQLEIDDPFYTNINPPVIKGEAEANSHITGELSQQGSVKARAEVDVNSPFSLHFKTVDSQTSRLPDGDYGLKAVLTDRAENTATQTRKLVLDTVAPDTPDKLTVEAAGVQPLDDGFQVKSFTFTVSGVAEHEGHIVRLELPNGQVYDHVKAGKDGVWSQPVSVSSEGRYVIKVFETDLATNSTPQPGSVTVAVEGVPLQILGVADQEATAQLKTDDTLTVRFNLNKTAVVSDSGEITCRLNLLNKDNTVFKEVTATLDRDATDSASKQLVFSYRIASGDHAEGVEVVSNSLVMTDEAAIKSTLGTPLQTDFEQATLAGLHIDAIAPNTPVILSISPDSGNSDSDLRTNVEEYSLKGQADAGSEVLLFDHGVALTLPEKIIASEGGFWEVLIEEASKEYTASYTAQCRDSFGNLSALSAAKEVIVDQVNPHLVSLEGTTTSTATSLKAGTEVTFKLVFNETVQLTGKPVLNIKVGDQVVPLEVKAEGDDLIALYTVQEGFQDSDGITAHSFVFTSQQPGAEGQPPATVNLGLITDLSGNPAESDLESLQNTHILIDAITPEIVIDPPKATADAQPVISGTSSEPLSQLELYVEGSKVDIEEVQLEANAWSAKLSQPLATDKHYSLKAVGLDKTGNEGASEPVDLHIDASLPYVSITSQPYSHSANLVIEGISNIHNGKVQLSLNKGQFTDLDTDAQGNWQYTVTAASEGLYQVEVTATGENKLSDTARIEITLDRTAPVFVSELGEIFTNNQPVFSMKLDTEADYLKTVWLAVNNETVLATYNSATKSWDATPLTPLIQGEQKIIFQAVDLADNEGRYEKIIHVDSLAPYIELDQSCLSAPALTPVFYGHGQNGTKAKLLIKDKVSGDTLDSLSQTVSQGSWKVTAHKALPAGDYTVQLTAEKEFSDGQTLVSKTVEFDLALQAPPETTPPAPDQDLLLTLDAIKPWHNLKKAVSLSGQAKEGSLVSVTIDGHDMGEVTAAPNNTWQMPLSPEQLSVLKDKEGAQDILVQARLDKAVAEVKNVLFGVDTTAPEITLNPLEVSGSKYTFSGTFSEQHPYSEAIRVLVIDTRKDSQDPSNYIRLTPQLKDGLWKAELDASDLPPGDKYLLIVKSKDKAGNDTTEKQTFNIETAAEPTPPEPATGLELTLAQCPDWINLQKPFKLSGSAKEGSQVSVAIAGHDFGTATADTNNVWKLDISPESLQAALSGQEGVKDVLVTASLGEDKDSKQDQVGIDTTGPVVTLDSYTTTATHHEFTGHIEEAHPAKKGLKLHLVDMEKGSSDQSHYIKLTPKVEGNQWTASIEHREALTPGDHYLLLASSRDAAGNVSSNKLRFDLKVPEVKAPEPTETPEPAAPVAIKLTLDPLPQLTNLGKSLSISGHASSGSVVAVEIGGQSLGSATAKPNNTWELLLSPEQLKGLPDGSLNVVASTLLDGTRSTDQATLVVDQSMPLLTLDTPICTQETPVFTGTIEEPHLASFEIQLLNGAGHVLDTLVVTYPETGTWKATGTQPQPSGDDYQLTWTATDQLGQKNVNTLPCAIQFTPATEEPESPVDLGLTLGKVPEWINLQQSVTLSGTAKEGSAVRVAIAGQDFGTATAGSNNAWQKEITPEDLKTLLTTGEGLKEVLVQAYLGKDSATANGQLGIDTTKPAITLDNYTTSETHHVFSGSFTEAHPLKAGMRVRLFDSGNDPSDKSKYQLLETKMLDEQHWQAQIKHSDVPPLVESYGLLLKSQDKAGNDYSKKELFELKPLVETRKPAIEVEITAAPAVSALNEKFEVSGTAKAGSTMAFELGSLKLALAPVVGGDGLWKVTYADIPETDRTSLPEGPLTFKAIASLEGHETSAKEQSIVVDRTKPEITIDHETLVDPEQKFTGTFTEDHLEGISAKLVASDNTELPLQVTWEGNKWTAIGQHSLAKGNFQFHITVTDQAGTTHTAKEELKLVAAETPEGPLAQAILDPASLATEQTTPVLQGTLSDINHEHLQGLTLELVNKQTSERLSLQVEPEENWNVQVPEALKQGSYTVTLYALDKNNQHTELASDTLDVFGKDHLFTLVEAQGASLIDGNLFLPLNSQNKVEGKVTVKTIPDSDLKLMLVNPSKGAGNIPSPDGQPVKTNKFGKATFDLSSMPASPGGLYTSGFTVKSPGSERGRADVFYLAMSPIPVYHYSFNTQTSADLTTQFRSLTFGQYSPIEGSMPAVAGTFGAGVQLGHGHLVNSGLPDILKGDFTVCADLQPSPDSSNFTLMGRPDGLMIGLINDKGQIGVSAGKQAVFSHSILGQDVPFHHVCLSRSVNPEGTQSTVAIAVDGKMEVENGKLDHPNGVNTDITAIGGYLDDEGHIIEAEGKLDNLKVFNEANRMVDASSDLYVVWSCPDNGKCAQNEYLPLGQEAVQMSSLSQGGDLYIEFAGLRAASNKGYTFNAEFDVRFNGQPVTADAQSPGLFKLTGVSAENLGSLEIRPSNPDSIYLNDGGDSIKSYGYTVKMATSLEGLNHPELTVRLDSDRLETSGKLHNVLSLPGSQVVMHYHQSANPEDKPMRGEELNRPIQQDHFHAVEGGKVANYDPQHDIIDLNKLLSGEHKVPSGVQELAALLCTREKAGSEGLIDQVLIRHKENAGDSHCDCHSKDDPAYTVNLLDPMHQPLLVVNYDGLQHDLYPSS